MRSCPEAGRVALAARRVERGDAHAPAERDRTADLGALQGRLAAVGRVAQREPRQLQTTPHHPGLDLEPRRGNPVVEARDLAIEPGQFALTDNVDEARPGLPVQRV